jgi:hypothetical protein
MGATSSHAANTQLPMTELRRQMWPSMSCIRKKDLAALDRALEAAKRDNGVDR